VHRNSEYPYSVTVYSITGDTYTVDMDFGDKSFKEEFYVGGGETVTRDFIAYPDYGYHNVLVTVKNSGGYTLCEYKDDVNVLPPVIEAYLAPYTRKLGLAGALAVSEADDVAQLDSHRLEFTWSTSETTKGVYNIEHGENIENAKNGNSEIIAVIDYNNKLYNGRKSVTNGVTTKENADGFAGFAKAVRDEYKENSPISYFEIWNEPNASEGFWKEADRVTDYVYLAEVSKRELAKDNPKEKTAVGAASNGDYYWVGQLFEEGLYPNMDAVSNHPYIWNVYGENNYLVDEKYHQFLSGMTGVITKYGGWKEQIITEIGWPTHTGGITKNQQAIELVKQAVVADYYDISTNQLFRSSDDFIWSDYSPDYSEDNFGIFYHGYNSLKPSAFAISNLSYETTGAVFAGKLPFENEDIEAYLYVRDNNITCIIWTKGADTIVTFEGENLTATDINGNYAGEGSTFEIGEAPVYIHGLSEKHIINSLSENIRDYIDLYLPLSFKESEGRKGFDKAVELLYSSADLIVTNALTALEEHYAVNTKLIDMYKNGELDISQEQLNGLLYLNQWGANLLSVVYMLSADGSDYEPTGMSEVLNAESYIKEKAQDNTLSYSSAILVYAEKFAEKAENLNKKDGTNPQKCGAVKAWDALSVLTAKTALEMAEVEMPGYDNVIIQLPSSQCGISAGVAKNIYVSVYNYRPSSAVSGKLELVSPGGAVVASSDFSVDSQSSAKIPLSVTLSSIESGDYKIRLSENGKVIKERTAKLSFIALR